jgi:hypothetical protein
MVVTSKYIIGSKVGNLQGHTFVVQLSALESVHEHKQLLQQR